MTRNRVLTGIAVAFVGVVLSGGVAGAVEGCSFSAQNCEAGTTTQSGEVLGEQLVKPAVQVASAPATAPTGGTLPFTGGDVAGLAALGAGAVAVGSVLTRRTRARQRA